MNFDFLVTVADCDAFITTYKQRNISVPVELMDRRAELVRLQGAGSDPNPVYSDFCRRHNPSPEMVKCIEDATNKLLDDSLDAERAKRPVMLLGKIQSGKTRAFVGVMGLAFDRGIDIAVVYTKGTNALAQQTVSRMKEEFTNFKPSDNLDQPCTILVRDIMDMKANPPTDREINSCKFVVVCKKEHNNTRTVKTLFKTRPLLLTKRVIVIDDEADFGGISFKRHEDMIERGKNAGHISDFINLMADCRSLLVTATPYSLYLQPENEVKLVDGPVRPLCPRSTVLVPIHPYYVGGKEYFIDSRNVDSMFHNLFHPVTEECLRVLGKRDRRYLTNIATSPNLKDFRHAILQYLVGTAIRSLQECRNRKKYRSSCIVHVDISRQTHEWQKNLIQVYLKHLEQNVFGSNPQDTVCETMIERIYQEFVDAFHAGVNEGRLNAPWIPTLKETREQLDELFRQGEIYVQVVNSDEDVTALLDEKGQLDLRLTANIFVGGSILDRGITIQNLIGFIYGRSPRRMQMDTVLQHARMYGARNMADMAVTRFHTTNVLYGMLKRINDMDEELRRQFIEAMKAGKDPETVFVLHDGKGGIVPCAASRLLITTTTTVAGGSRHLPIGFQTGPQSQIHRTIEAIDKLITTSPDYAHKDAEGFFKIDRATAISILRKIRTTYIYNRPVDENEGLEWDVEEMISVLEWALDQNQELICLHREGRDMSRLRANGAFVDAPDDGHSDIAPSRRRAIDLPVLMLIKENGEEKQGWRGTPFYWPVLLIQKNVRPAIYGRES